MCHGTFRGVTVYEDFAHHPTAIASTLRGLKAHIGVSRLLVVLELASFTMRTGSHPLSELTQSWDQADFVYILHPDAFYDAWEVQYYSETDCEIYSNLTALRQALYQDIRLGDTIIIMSNHDCAAISVHSITCYKTNTIRN